MNERVGELLAAHGARAAELLAGGAAALRDEGTGIERARRFVDAVGAGLRGDLRPLQKEYQLSDRSAGVDDRLDACLHRLANLEDALGRDEPDLDRELSREFAGLARRVAVVTVRQLAEQAGSGHTATSLSVTMHELRRPLTILSSYGQLLATGVLGPLPEAANVALEGISASTEMMVRMVNALAEVSRLEDPDDELIIEDLHCDEVINGAVEQVGMEAQLRDIEIRREVGVDAVVQADRRRLVLALTNMISNAVKHSPNNGEVLVRAWRNSDSVHFTVADSGPGFPPEDGPRLFEKYFRSVAERKRRIPGSGLGLYIVKTVADRHGGTVSARNPEEGGAEFELELPARRA